MTLGIYVHLPFCRAHCAYCPFAISTDLSPQSAYFDALIREIDVPTHGEDTDTIFIVGGTPALTAPHSVTPVVTATPPGFQVADARTSASNSEIVPLIAR